MLRMWVLSVGSRTLVGKVRTSLVPKGCILKSERITCWLKTAILTCEWGWDGHEGNSRPDMSSASMLLSSATPQGITEPPHLSPSVI